MQPLRTRPLAMLPLAGALLAAACDRGAAPAAADGDAGGVLVIALPADPGAIVPTNLRGIQARQVADLVYDPLVEVGPENNTLGDVGFGARLAERWTWGPDSLSISFALHPQARWHDGRPVRASDVRFTFELNRDSLSGSSTRDDLARIDSVTTPDSLTAVFWFAEAYPEQFFDAGGRTHILPEHLWGSVPRDQLETAPAATAPVGSGPFRLVRAEPMTLVELGANTDYHLGRPKLDRVLMRVATDPAAAASQLLAGEADFYEALTPPHVRSVAAEHPDVVVHTGPGSAYAFMQFNHRDPRDLARPHPLFADQGLRRAVTMLIDRRAIARSVLDTLGAMGLGPFPRALPTADTTVRQIPFDPAAAEALLDSLGWRDGDGDGVRERDGRRLAFDMIVPTASAPRMQIAVILQEQLARSGVQVQVEKLEFNAFMAKQSERGFDAALGAWVLSEGSPAGTRNTWGSSGIGGEGGQNYGAYSNPAFDAQVDSGLAAYAVADRRAHFSRAYQIAVDDAPAVWLYEPLNAYGIHRRFQTPPMRPSAWWLDIRHWWIPADQRIARDGAGLPTVAQQ